MTTEEMKASLLGLQSDLIQIAGECMLEHKEEIAFLVVQQQYEDNIDGRGRPLRPYSRPYGKRKGNINVNYHVTGEMQQEMTLIVEEETYHILSKKEVNGYQLSTLLIKRDFDSFELTDEHKIEAYNIIAPDFEAKAKEILGV